MTARADVAELTRLKAVNASLRESVGKPARLQLHQFVDAAAEEGLILGGIDAAELYQLLFPEEYERRLREGKAADAK